MNHYYTTGTVTGTNIIWSTNSELSVNGEASYEGQVQFKVDKPKNTISPILYFSYIKKKFKLLERRKLTQRLDSIESAFDEAVSNGQNVLGTKILEKMVVLSRESAILAKGITKYVERDDIMKFKHKIRDGHISDTKLKDYTRVIPKSVSKRIQEVRDVFDDFVIFHYYNEDQKDVKEMSRDERTNMRDPVIFGIIRENNRLYFVAEWEDEFCDLTFDEMVNAMGKIHLGKINKKVDRKELINA